MGLRFFALLQSYFSAYAYPRLRAFASRFLARGVGRKSFSNVIILKLSKNPAWSFV